MANSNTMITLIQEAPNINPSMVILGDIRTIIDLYKLNVFDAAIHYSEISGSDIEHIGELIRNDPLLSSMATKEAEELNIIPKFNRLDFDE